jgi:DNA-binding NarL/FixJ family response regulator
MTHLTPRERQVAALVAKGFTNREIGQKLGITEQVVKNYMRDIFDRTGCWTRLELAVYVVGHQQAA